MFKEASSRVWIPAQRFS